MFNDLHVFTDHSFGMRSISDIVTIRPDQYKTRELDDLKEVCFATDYRSAK
ncbi:unnamed protein product, partial [Brassica rapa]